MQTTTPYQRLSSTEREEFSRSLAQGTGLSAMARRVSRAPSTVAREVQHNSGKRGYRAFSAGNRATARAASRKQGTSRLTRDDRLRGYVMETLRKRWSPREIVKRLAAELISLDFMDTGLRTRRHCFDLGGGVIAEGRMQAESVIEYLDPFKNVLPGFFAGPIPLMMHVFRFQRKEEAFHDGFVPAVSAPTHARRQAVRG